MNERILSVLITAMGGQGGAVLTEWLVQAAMLEGFPVQSTSLPGVAQRTGSTTYYLELLPIPQDELADQEPIFSLHPTPGDVDLLIAQEFLELGRAIEQGFASPDRTVILASTSRLYSIYEKSPPGRGIYPGEAIETAARALSRRLIAFDALALGRAHGFQEVNAILLGALAAAKLLPIREQNYRKAVEQGGIAVERNLAAFQLGYDHVNSGRCEERPEPGPAPGPTHGIQDWEAFAEARAIGLGRRGATFRQVIGQVEREFPPTLWELLGEGVARLIDYQSAPYARLYLDWLRPLLDLDSAERGYRLARRFARHLAVWMSYEDAVRVAELKTRPERFARIRTEMGMTDGQVLRVTDFLKPDIDEIYGVLPHALVGRFARWAERRWPGEKRPAFAQKVRTTRFAGFLRVWLLTRLRPLRPISERYRREHMAIAIYRAWVERVARTDYALGVEVAEAATMVKGYGAVRRRGLAAFDRYLEEIVAPLLAQADRALISRLLAEARQRILAAPEGIDAAVTLVREALVPTPNTPGNG